MHGFFRSLEQFLLIRLGLFDSSVPSLRWLTDGCRGWIPQGGTSDPAPAGLGAPRAGGESRRVKTGGRPEALSAFLGLQLPPAPPGDRVIRATLAVNQLTTGVASCPATFSLIVLGEPLLRVLTYANVEAPGAGTPQDIHVACLARNAGHEKGVRCGGSHWTERASDPIPI